MNDQPRFLVTGGTGFIGRRLVLRLIEAFGPESIVCLTKAPVTLLEAKAVESYRGAGVRLIEGNLLNQPVSAQPAPRVDAVFHLAANIDTDAPEDALRVNDEGTRRLLRHRDGEHGIWRAHEHERSAHGPPEDRRHGGRQRRGGLHENPGRRGLRL